MNELTRRTVLAGACGTCAATLAGCATYVSGTPAQSAAPAPSAAAAGPLPGTPLQSAAPSPDDGAAAAGPGLAATADIPVGGGKIFADEDVVITQPTAGKFVAFSATCTHQGCKVGTVSGTTVKCPCHGSTFAIADGSVVDGPAKKGLPKRAITVAGGQISLA